MPDRPSFPGYDTLAKRDTPSWNAATREAIDLRLAAPREPRFFSPEEWACADALCQRILPGRVEPPLVALLDAALCKGDGDGTRTDRVPYLREAWRSGLAAIDRSATDRHGSRFTELAPQQQDDLLASIQRDTAALAAIWGDLDPAQFFARRVLADIPALFYALPQAWDEIGFGGPASPRGYVRLDLGHRDPWEAAETGPDGDHAAAEQKNRHVV